MRTRFLWTSALTAILLLAGCSSAISSGSGDDDGEGETPDSLYSFEADYANVSWADATNPVDKGYGAIFSFQGGSWEFPDALSIEGESIDAMGLSNNNMTQHPSGSVVALSVTLDGIVFTGSAVVPDVLVDVQYDAEDRFLTWDTQPLSHEATHVTVRKTPADGATALVAYFDAGALTIPSEWLAGVGRFTVFATNQATSLEPADSFDPDRGYFRVSHADGVADAFDPTP